MNVKHYLEIYITRKKLQDEGITNPTKGVKILTKSIIEKLSLMSLEEKIDIIDNLMVDSKGNTIITFPK